MISARHLKHVVKSQAGRDFVAAVLCDLTNGQFSADMKPLFLTSTGGKVPKGDGSVRPICVGDIFYRLACSRLIHLAQKPLKLAVGNNQLGVATSSGCEKIVHSVQALLEHSKHKLACLEIDTVNAFNTRSRSKIFSSLFSHPALASLWRMCHWSYAMPSDVHFLDEGSIVHVPFVVLSLPDGIEDDGGNMKIEIKNSCETKSKSN